MKWFLDLFKSVPKVKEPKVLKVKVRHFKEDKFCIEYSYEKEGKEYYMELKNWIYHPDYNVGMAWWNPVLKPVKEAEALASTFKTIEDINKFNDAEEQKRTQYEKDKALHRLNLTKEYNKKYVPYKTKQIIG